MKKNIMVCGLISGALLAGMMVASVTACYNNDNFEDNMVLGYAAMILSFSLIFVGVKNYRDKYQQGIISFGKAFRIGLYITLIASSVYVLVWLIDYYLFIPDFMDKYTAHVLRQSKADGATAAEMKAKAAEMMNFKEMYKNPFFVVLITFAEVVPIGLAVALVSAFILKRKQA
ncbi:hypothetical protein DYBT9275_05600 [Dyadobacter sp. CECT 9275]|uniref:DUF4199 domain-containing protein n=1 Tax=Dyadobacter helix TaxID=2822344 RepID=A0A916NNR8_9BACT|nr:DUF4199 domain-containing protein [Dyadobacter sp. CECT 9275]CAG5016651.1 hypothetical protein DYBT9275_05600 [Dyadobacter sp. CECT 9275]